MDGTSPTARALLTLDLLQQRRQVTAAELAGRLHVTERAARRYIAILREAGIPVLAERGPYGGYRLGHARRSPALVLDSSEALGLVMAALDGAHAVGDAGAPVGAALGKLIGSLPGPVGQTAAAMRSHVLSAPEDPTRRPDPTVAAGLISASERGRRVRLAYRTASGSDATFEVEPWAVVVRFGRWYLLCFSHTAGAVRTLRVDRMSDLAELVATFSPPVDLDPVALLEEHLGSGWTYPTRVVLDAAVEDVRPFVPASMGRLEADGDTRCVLVGSTDNPEMYAFERLAAIPCAMRVEGGDELRAAVAALAGRMADATREE